VITVTATVVTTEAASQTAKDKIYCPRFSFYILGVAIAAPFVLKIVVYLNYETTMFFRMCYRR